MDSSTPDEHDDQAAGEQPHPDLPLEVLEDDEDVPPRPEESVADAPPVG